MKLIITNQAQKDLSKLDKATQRRVQIALDRMLLSPQNADIKKLKGEVDLWRLRVGNYRVIMRIKGSEVVIYALRILHRREAYK
ncbi:MAG: type II toxin-antitoxin system RelE/ParE family toxin [Bacillota bacterium]